MSTTIYNSNQAIHKIINKIEFTKINLSRASIHVDPKNGHTHPERQKTVSIINKQTSVLTPKKTLEHEIGNIPDACRVPSSRNAFTQAPIKPITHTALKMPMAVAPLDMDGAATGGGDGVTTGGGDGVTTGGGDGVTTGGGDGVTTGGGAAALAGHEGYAGMAGRPAPKPSPGTVNKAVVGLQGYVAHVAFMVATNGVDVDARDAAPTKETKREDETGVETGMGHGQWAKTLSTLRANVRRYTDRPMVATVNTSLTAS